MPQAPGPPPLPAIDAPRTSFTQNAIHSSRLPCMSHKVGSSVLASAVVGVVLGIVGVLGVAGFSGQTTVPTGGAVPADEAVLGVPEYGSRG